jgi:VCBS repeat-containing protein
VFDQDDFTATVPEDISDTFVIVAATAVDADGAPVSYSITGGNASGLFEICGGCGAVSLAPGRTLDAETTISHVLTVTASESDGPGTDTATVTITVTDVNEFGVGPVTDANGNANTISEDASAGTSAQITAFATDDDLTNNTINYSLASGVLDNDLFQIDSVSGVVTLSGALDAETNSNLTIEVTASSSDGSSNTGQFDITVTDVNEFPLGSVTDSNTAANTIAENATAGTLAQITASATDPDISDTVAYSLATGVLDNDLFVINPTSGEVRLKTSGTLSGLANTSLTIEVTATSSDTSSNSAQFPIMVTEVDDFDVGPVTDIDDAANTISEDAGTGATVGITAFATDDDVSNNTITYSLAAGTEDNDLFVIDSSTGVVTLKTGGSLDAETATSLTVEITASSSDGSSSTAQFDIAVTDINEFPVGPVTDSDGTANTIAENAAAGTPARITASATDADATNNTITYSLATGVLDNDLFVIDSSTGVVTLKTTRSLDGLAGTSLTIEVTATSSDTSSNSAQFTIDVTESNDPPVVDTTDVTAAVTEAVTPVGNLTDSGTIGFSDVDTNDVHSIDGTITASPGALGSLTASVTTQTNSSGTGGVITWIYSVPAADVEFLAQGQTKVETFTITLDDGNSGRVARTITATITGTNDVPIVATTDLTGAVTELGTPAGNLTDSGTIGFSDVDVNDSHNIDSTITASPGALGNLTASVTTATSNGTGGVITWNYSVPAAALEFLAQGETKIETFTVTLDDDNGGTVDRTITMTITGENDAPVSEPPITASFNKEDASGTVDLLQNASDVDSTTLNVSSATVRANGADPGGITFDAANNRLVVNPDFYSDIEQTIDFVFDVTITDGIDSVNTTATVSIVAFPPTDITGTLFIDERNPARNSVFDSDEDGLTGIRVHLRSAAANNSTGQDIDLKTLSDAYGQYAFLGVPPGTYELEYDLPSQVVYVGSNTMTIVVNPSDGTPFPPLSFAALGLSGSLASLDIIASTYLNDHGQISHDSNGGLEGGSVKLRADGSQEMIVLADGFEGADFVEFVLNEDKTAGAITKVVDGIRSTAVVSGDHFVLAADGCSIRFFGGLDDFIFDDSVASEFPALGTAVDEYFENLGQL